MEDKQSFINLVNDLYTENRESALARLVDLFKTETDLINLLVNECATNADEELRNKEFINQLINLPQITGNVFKLLNDPLFTPDNYFKVLCSIIGASLERVQ